MLPIVPGAIGDNPEPNPNDNHERGFLRFMLKNDYIQNSIRLFDYQHHKE